jgi:hypothetical protein
MHVSLRTLIAISLLLPLTGCRVESRKGDHGDKDVAISTPLGGMTVKTDSASVSKKVGLPLYPGAVLEKKKDKDGGSADVDMSFGAFHLRVLALSFESNDSPEKVSDFYKKALSQYSDVITCRHKQPVGTPVKTGLGLTCTDDDHISARGKVKVNDEDDDDADEIELKAGSPARQHIVSFKSNGGGTRFGLIALDLPRSDSKGD